MKKNQAKQKLKLPGWLKEKIEESTRVKVKEATVDYIRDKGLQKKLPPANAETYFKILPYMTRIDSDWGVVTSKVFNTGKFYALETYGQTIRNFLNGKAIKQAIKDADAAELLEKEQKEESIYMTDDEEEDQDDS
jgi:hypothetical protein